MSAEPIDLAGILEVPATIKAIIWDLDGVLVDTLGEDYRLCVAAADRVVGRSDWIKQATVAKHFALDPPAFWHELLLEAPSSIPRDKHGQLVKTYDQLRGTTPFALLPGVEDVLAGCEHEGIRCAVASSNPAPVVEEILERAGISGRFAAVSALGAPGVNPKPTADLYLNAVKALGIPAASCAFVEDSVTGLTSGRAARLGHAIAVATGPASFASLISSGLADTVYNRFERRRCHLVDGQPIQKRLDTPNDFASHMAEHIAWRLGVGIDLSWHTNDWRGLGSFLGAHVKKLRFRKAAASALGMIDDGASEVLIAMDEPPGLDFSVHGHLSREKIERMRVEQISAGRDLLDMLDGFAQSLGAHITARMCTFEDPHHSWEGLFRAVGICLARLRER